ncbi:MAG: thermostable hemolysin [Gammaproteobacteria bacterium]|jgi:hypothetical protein|nr:hypothetical protein [Chromatiales bacterium]MDP6415190.1 thermostable hemolysin [Gammaproteobacteria bacterium]MDP6674492.1 thermostable hemolysin [Gammaproteobacteria bacterium]
MGLSAALPLQTIAPRIPAASKALNRLLQLKPSFTLHHARDPQRPELETYISQQFAGAYGATITEFLPTLSSMQCQGNISAVGGIRTAHYDDLFVEQYLDKPIEQILSRLLPADVSRSEIIEIGNLSATHRGATLLFFIVQIAMLHEAGFKQAVFTATEQVEKIISKLNFATLSLAPADPARLGNDAADWGHYYDTQPTVCAIDIASTMARLRQSPLPAAVMIFFNDTIAELTQSMKVSAWK